MNALTVTTIDNEPRVLDTALAEQLGFARSYAIRQLITANREELEAFGPLPTEHGQSRGQPFTAYHLNRQQALLVCILSRTERAKEVRAEVIRRFDAYEHLVQAVRPAIPNFSNPAEAARAWADEYDQKVIAHQRIAELEPVARVGEMACAHDHSLSRFVRTLDGVNTLKIKSDLLLFGYLYKKANTYRVYSRHASLFKERIEDGYGTVEIFPTATGKQLIVKLYREGKLTMKVGARRKAA